MCHLRQVTLTLWIATAQLFKEQAGHAILPSTETLINPDKLRVALSVSKSGEAIPVGEEFSLDLEGVLSISKNTLHCANLICFGDLCSSDSGGGKPRVQVPWEFGHDLSRALAVGGEGGDDRPAGLISQGSQVPILF